MLTIDERTLGPIDGVGDGDGRFYPAKMELTATWEVTEEAVTERRVVREYPNGGKDIETVVVSPERGEWRVSNGAGSDLTGLVDVPEWADKSHGAVSFIADVRVFHQWEPGEADEYAAEEKRKALLDHMLQSGFVDGTDDAVCELYELSVAQQAALEEQQRVIDEQDAAICALYEMIGE